MNYKWQADLFGVYCPELDKVYLVPVSEVGNRTCNLRIQPSKQNKKVRLATDYEV